MTIELDTTALVIIRSSQPSESLTSSINEFLQTHAFELDAIAESNISVSPSADATAVTDIADHMHVASGPAATSTAFTVPATSASMIIDRPSSPLVVTSADSVTQLKLMQAYLRRSSGSVYNDLASTTAASIVTADIHRVMSDSSASGVTQSISLVLPCPAMGDCAFYALLAAYLCPVAHDIRKFDERLIRLAQLSVNHNRRENQLGTSTIAVPVSPLPMFPLFQIDAGPVDSDPDHNHDINIGSSLADSSFIVNPVLSDHHMHVHTRAYDVIRECTLQEFLLEFRDAGLGRNPNDSLWLCRGPPPYDRDDAPQKRYVAVISFLAALVQYTRRALAWYRETCGEFDFDPVEYPPGTLPHDRPSIRQEMLRDIYTSGKSLLVDNMPIWASLLGCRIVIKHWSAFGAEFEYTAIHEPKPSWLTRHQQHDHEQHTIQLYFVNFLRSTDPTATPNHFEAIVDVEPAPSISAAASARVTKRSRRRALPSATTRDRRDWSDDELQQLTHLWWTGVRHQAAVNFTDLARAFSARLECTPAHIRPWFVRRAAKINSLTVTVSSYTRPLVAAGDSDQTNRMQQHARQMTFTTGSAESDYANVNHNHSVQLGAGNQVESTPIITKKINRDQRRRIFSADEIELLSNAYQQGVTSQKCHLHYSRQLSEWLTRLSPHQPICTPEHVAGWFRRVRSGRYSYLNPAAFSSPAKLVSSTALTLTVPANMRRSMENPVTITLSGSVPAIAKRAPSALNEIQDIAIVPDSGLGNSEELNSANQPVPHLPRTLRRFNLSEQEYLKRVKQLGISGDGSWSWYHRRIADIFNESTQDDPTSQPCKPSSVRKALSSMSGPGGSAHRVGNAYTHSKRLTINAAATLDVELPPYDPTTEGLKKPNPIRKKAAKPPTNISFPRDLNHAWLHFWETSGLHASIAFRRRLNENQLQCHSQPNDSKSIDSDVIMTHDDHRAEASDLSSIIGPPISDAIRSKCIREYNQYMDPHTPMLLCASCGIYEFRDIHVPVDVGGNTPAGPGLWLSPSIVIEKKPELQVLQLSPEEEQAYLQIAPELRCAHSITTIMMCDEEGKRTIPSYWHLQPELTFIDEKGQTRARFCSTCSGSLRRKHVPRYSLADGIDFGRPAALGLVELSLLEQQLIACFRVFSNVIKLVAPFGSNARQSAFSGHSIVFAHDGPVTCARKLPRLENIHQYVSVLFIGTTDQWNSTSTRPTLLRRFNGIFQVRRAAVLLWLRMLKQVGHPLYQHIVIADENESCWREMETLADECLDRAQIAEDPVTRHLEHLSTSDVSGARNVHLNETEESLAAAIANHTATDNSLRISPNLGNVGLPAVFLNTQVPIVVRPGPPAADVVGPSDTTQSNNQTIMSSAETSADSGPDSLLAQSRLQLLTSLRRAMHPNEFKSDDPIRQDSSQSSDVPVSATMADRATLPIPLLPGCTPVNEYTENDLLLNGSYPTLFFLGAKLPMSGSVPKSLQQRILRQYDQRFSRNHQLLFLLFNQLQRHAVSRTVAARVKSDPKSVLAFHEMVAQPDFDLALTEALRQPKSAEAEKLIHRVLPMLHIAGRAVPFGGFERKQALPKLIAYNQFFGLPTFFLTISPSDLDQPLTVRIAIPSSRNRTAGSSIHLDTSCRNLEYPLPSLAERSKILANNPVAAADVFQRIMQTIMKTMIGLMPFDTGYSPGYRAKRMLPALKDRDQRVLGIPVAHFFVFESQGRGTLHTHGVVWTKMTSAILEDVADRPDLVRVLGDAIDQICTASLPIDIHKRTHEQGSAAGTQRTSDGLRLTRPIESDIDHMNIESNNRVVGEKQLPASFHPNSLDERSFEQRWQHLAAVLQLHLRHALTCRKGTAGKYGCRMGMPQARREEPTGPSELHAEINQDTGKMCAAVAIPMVSLKKRELPPTEESAGGLKQLARKGVLPPRDVRCLAWDLHRPLPEDMNIVSFNPTLTAAIASNTALYLLGSSTQAKAVLFYLLKYMTKDSTAITNSLSAVHEARRHIQAFPSVAADTGQPQRTAQHLLNRIVNNISGKTETSAEMAAASLLGMPSTSSSHGTWFCFIWPAVRNMHSLLAEKESDSESETSSSECLEESDIDHHDDSKQGELVDEFAEEERRQLPVQASTDSELDITANVVIGPIGNLIAETDHTDDIIEIAQNELYSGTNSESLNVYRLPSESKSRNNGDSHDPINSVTGGSHSNSESDCDTRVIPQHVHYHFRGPNLQQLCFYEWCALISIEPISGDASGTRRKSLTKGKERRSPNLRKADGNHNRVIDNVAIEADSDESDESNTSANDSDSDSESSETQNSSAVTSDSECTSASTQSKQATPHALDSEVIDKARKIKRTSPNARTHYSFHPAHPLATTHQQYLRPCYLIPVLAGNTCPRYPGPSPSFSDIPSTSITVDINRSDGDNWDHGHSARLKAREPTRSRVRVWERCAKTYAEFMLALFVPWKLPCESDPDSLVLRDDATLAQLGPDIPINYESFCRVFTQYRDSSELTLQCRAECIMNLSGGTRTNALLKQLLNLWRTRAAKRWGAADDKIPSSLATNIDSMPGDNQLDIDNSPEDRQNLARAREIQEALQREAQATMHDMRIARSMTLAETHRTVLKSMYGEALAKLWSDRDNDHMQLGDNERMPQTGPGPQTRNPIVSVTLTGSDLKEFNVAMYLEISRVDAVLGALREDNVISKESDSTQQNEFKSDNIIPGGRRSTRLIGRHTRSPHGEPQSSISLNSQQEEALGFCTRWLEQQRAHESQPSLYPFPQPLLLLIQGGAGVGKSTFARALVERTRISVAEGQPLVNTVLCAAPTGIAASLLVNGRTLHSLLNIRSFNTSARRSSLPQRVPPLGAVPLAAMRERFRHHNILLIDEASMVGARMLATIDIRLRQIWGEEELPFGGMGIVLMGDFFQLEAVCDTMLPTAALTASELNLNANKSHQLVDLTTTGGLAFTKFHIRHFTMQMRVVSTDVEHTELVRSFQNPTATPSADVTDCHRISTNRSASQFGTSLVARLERMYLTASRVAEDPSWKDAVIIVPTNAQRFALLEHLVLSWAKSRNRPALRWRYHFPQQQLTKQEIEAIYSKFPELTGYFVPGAPVFITENVNATKGVANGTSATMHSLSWSDPGIAEEIQQVIQEQQLQATSASTVTDTETNSTLTFNSGSVPETQNRYTTSETEFIDVPLPYTINVELSKEACSSHTFTENETLVSGKIIIPLKCEGQNEIHLRHTGRKEVMSFKEFICELAFVITFHKCQGRTMNKVILDLNRQPEARANVSYSSLYVGLSRVRRGADVSLFPILPHPTDATADLSPRAYLQRLMPHQDLITWLQGYNQQGVWDIARVRLAMRGYGVSAVQTVVQRKRKKRAARARENSEFAALSLEEAPGTRLSV